MVKTDFDGRIAVINASNSELDVALAKALMKNGARVALCCRPDQRLNTSELDGVERFDLCLSDFSGIDAVVDHIVEKMGSIDILINNPIGVFPTCPRVPLHEMEIDTFVEVTDAWLKGLMRFSKRCAHYMGEQRKGCIVNVISVRGLTVVANQTISVAVSAAINGMTRMWGVEMRDYNIRANGVAVGVLESEPELPCGDAVRFSHANIKRPCKLEEATNAVLFLASDAASYITGTVLPVDGGISAGFARSF